MENFIMSSYVLLNAQCVVGGVWTILLIAGSLFLIAKIIEKIGNARDKCKRQERLADYCQKRSEFYQKEREKVLNYYREKAHKKGGLTDEELEEARFYMEINSGDEDGWKEEYKKFRQELHC